MKVCKTAMMTVSYCTALYKKSPVKAFKYANELEDYLKSSEIVLVDKPKA